MDELLACSRTSVNLICRLWDTYLSNHVEIASMHVYVCAAIVTSLSPKRLGVSHAVFVMKIQSINPDGWSVGDLDMIVAQAYVYEKMFSGAPSHLKST